MKMRKRLENGYPSSAIWVNGGQPKTVSRLPEYQVYGHSEGSDGYGRIRHIEELKGVEPS